LYELVVYPT